MKKVLIALMFVPSIVFANEDLLKKNGCIACHAVDKKLVGPSFKDISLKYKSKKDGAAYLAGKIRSGVQDIPRGSRVRLRARYEPERLR